MKCLDCPYFWVDYDGFVPRCHYRWNDGDAPCEIMDGCADYDIAEEFDDDNDNA